MSNLQSVIDRVLVQIDFADDALEAVVEKAFLAGGTAMKALLAIDSSNDPAAPIDDYVDGITGLTQSVGSFLGSLSDDQVAAYKANLKKVITNVNPAVETALEDFADANLDLTAAVIDMNDAIDALQP